MAFKKNSCMLVAGIIFFIIGFWALYRTYTFQPLDVKAEVMGECRIHKMHRYSHSHFHSHSKRGTKYKITYIVNNTKYEGETHCLSDVLSHNYAEDGSMILKIKYNPINPKDFDADPDDVTLFGIIFVLGGLVMIFVEIKNNILNVIYNNIDKSSTAKAKDFKKFVKKSERNLMKWFLISLVGFVAFLILLAIYVTCTGHAIDDIWLDPKSFFTF